MIIKRVVAAPFRSYCGRLAAKRGHYEKKRVRYSGSWGRGHWLICIFGGMKQCLLCLLSLAALAQPPPANRPTAAR